QQNGKLGSFTALSYTDGYVDGHLYLLRPCVGVCCSVWQLCVCEKGSLLTFSEPFLTPLNGRSFHRFLLRQSVRFTATHQHLSLALPSFPLRCDSGGGVLRPPAALRAPRWDRLQPAAQVHEGLGRHLLALHR